MVLTSTAPPPTHVGPLVKPNMALMPISQEQVCITLNPKLMNLKSLDNDVAKVAHWAQQIFSLPLPSRTPLKGSKRYVDP